MKQCLLLLTLCLITHCTIYAQDVSGVWKGGLTITGGCFPENHIELQLTISGSYITGSSYQYLNTENYIRKDINGTYDRTSQSFSIQESAAIRYQIPNTCSICIKNYRLTYTKEGDKELLTGTWTGNIMGSGNRCQPGTIVLSRSRESVFKEPPRINVDTGMIRLDFYDNGEIDGDSISVMVNKNVVVSHQKLGIKPITTHIKVDVNSPFQQVEMIAENLGSIPPNTALLIITAGKKKYRLFLSSTNSKTAMVRFVYSADVAKEADN